ncbi:MAG: hypothetical protein K8S55_00840 [Phycisphaerae bacterium]|nr:hypothetical protein [Phycisphaerae bacterium]
MNTNDPSENPRSQTPPRKILIVTASVGAGHNQAARALAEGIGNFAPHIELAYVDVLDFTPKLFRAWYAGGYSIAVTKLPRLYGLGYAITDRPTGPGRTLSERHKLWKERLALKAFGRYVAELQPDLILHTHFLAPPYLARQIAGGQLAARQQVVITDIEVHRWWYSRQVEHWYVGHDIATEQLGRYDIDPGRVTVSGMPVHPKWIKPLPPRAEILAEWSLPDNRQIVLLSGGTEFTCGPIVKIARQLVAACPNACVVVLGGRNKKLLGTLAKLPEAQAGKIVPTGFTDRLHELVEVADLMITKPGGMTTAECIAKATPMVFLRPVPGQEQKNAEFVSQRGGGVITRNPRQVIAAATELLVAPDKLAEMSACMKKLYRPGTQTIVEAVCR